MSRPDNMHLTFDQIKLLHDKGAIGTIELRDWVSELDPTFKKIRKEEVDEQIVELAERYRNYEDWYRERLAESRPSYGGVPQDELDNLPR